MKLIKKCKWCNLEIWIRKDGFEIWKKGDSKCKHSIINKQTYELLRRKF